MVVNVVGVVGNLLNRQHLFPFVFVCTRSIYRTAVLERTVSGKYKVTIRHDKPLTYEQSLTPPQIAHRKSWNSWNTSSLLDEPRRAETTLEDFFIRKFMFGTWHRLFLSDVIIKRRHNMIFVAGIIHQGIFPRKMYFLIGYTEEILSYILKCPVKLELQSTPDKKDVIFKYI